MTGMNAFAASVILSCCELQELLDMSPEQRVQAFAPLVGSSVIVSFLDDMFCSGYFDILS